MKAEYNITQKPISLNNVFKNAGKKRIKTPEYKSWCTAVDLELMSQKQPKIQSEYALEIRIPEGSSRADIDNLIKPISDALVRVGATPDDRKMFRCCIAREPRGNTRIIIVEKE